MRNKTLITCAALVERLNRRARSKRARLRCLAEIPFGEQIVLRRFVLGNGLTVLLLVDNTAPVLSYHTWFRVGSRHDRPGKTGLAHLFEHLMFNETRHLPAGAFDRTLEAAGGETNAATWVDWTFYHANLPASELALIVRLEADRMANLILRDAQVVSEKEVVANERRYRVEDDVEGTVSEKLYAMAFQRHPYGQPTVGWMKDIEGFTKGDCRRFYRTYYAPNNATLVVVGDISEERALALIQDHYGQLSAARLPPMRRITEAPQRAERRVRLRRPTPTERVQVGYRAPSFGDGDYVPLAIVNDLLFGGRSSRLFRRLVRGQELAVEVRGALTPFQDPGLYELWIALRQGRTGAEALSALDEELTKLKEEPVSQRELEKVKNRLDLGFLQSLETAAGKAERIGFYETVLGDAGELFRRQQAYQKVSADDIQRVAQRYLQTRGRTVISVVPGRGEAP
jgi:zinc protease